MKKDILFTLTGSFTNGLDGPLYCPECATLEGLLNYFPEIRKNILVVTLPFERPRKPIIEMLGEENQECPCLIPADPAKAAGVSCHSHEGTTFINDHKAIIEYLARNYGTSRPSHD